MTAVGKATGKGVVWGLGRRKRAVARVQLKSGQGSFLVNGRDLEDFFLTYRDRNLARAPLGLFSGPSGEGSEEGTEAAGAALGQYDISVRVHGGGPHGQAGAVQLGVARALKEANPALFESLREKGYLTRDARMKERKKYGRRGARRGFQFSKR